MLILFFTDVNIYNYFNEALAQSRLIYVNERWYVQNEY